eukprot:12830819-Alexandrium_andersonii.AAC.1
MALGEAPKAARALVSSRWTAARCARRVSHAWCCVPVLGVWLSCVGRRPESARLEAISSELRECGSRRRRRVGVGFQRVQARKLVGVV